ncbi:MAG TPA: hypothetical protein VII53_08485 [Solirubrobacteraceae bacterium]
MGLLDDAIREHMELKRLRGADPSEVAREEQDVLGPVHLQEQAEPQAPEPESEHDPAEAKEIAPFAQDALEDAPRAEADPPRRSPPAREQGEQDFTNVGQETAELDMRTVLHAEQSAEGASQLHEQEQEEQVEDVLEETPDFLRDTPEQERLWFEQQPPRDFDFDK